MPLEFNAARLLVSEGFSVNADFRYSWSNTETARDAAIDLHASTRFPAQSEGVGVTALVELMVDCLHRSPHTAGLFLPDVNPAGSSPTAPGDTVRIVDQFSPYVIAREPSVRFDEALAVCYKGLEIDTKTGEADDLSIKKGIRRLQNTLPRLLSENILIHMGGPVEENLPFVFCPILLTTAPLYVLHPDVTLAEIESAAEVSDVSESVPFLVLQSDYSPAFKTRCAEECDRLRPLLRTDEGMRIEMKRVRYYNSHANLPFTIIDGLNESDYVHLNRFFTRFVICRNTEFPAFIHSLKTMLGRALENVKLL